MEKTYGFVKKAVKETAPMTCPTYALGCLKIVVDLVVSVFFWVSRPIFLCSMVVSV